LEQEVYSWKRKFELKENEAASLQSEMEVLQQQLQRAHEQRKAAGEQGEASEREMSKKWAAAGVGTSTAKRKP
jgi:hypothetical protein